MARAYSEDLRIRIVNAYEQGLGSVIEIANQFQVGKTFVHDLIKRWHITGSVTPLPRRGGARPKLNQARLQKLEAMVQEKNDATLEELSERLEQETGVKVSVPTVHRALLKLDLTRKKNFS